MPINRKVTIKTGSEKAARVLASFNPLEVEMDFEDAGIQELVREMATTGSGRSPEELDQIAADNFTEAFKGLKVAVVNDEGQQPVLAQGSINRSLVEEDVDVDTLKNVCYSACVFAFLHGSVTHGKYWFLVGKKGKGKKMYASLPLDVEGRRSTLVHVYREEIGKFLAMGHDNVLISALKRSGITVEKSKRKYCFPKGHLLLGKPELISKVRGEISNIFEQLKKKSVDDRKFDVPWFTSP